MSETVYNKEPSAPPTKEQQENRAKAIMTQAQLREKVARGFDLGKAAMGGSYEILDGSE